LIVRRQWRALAAFVVAFGLLLGLSVVLAGWTAHEQFALLVLPSVSGGIVLLENQSLLGFLGRLEVGPIDPAAVLDIAEPISNPTVIWAHRLLSLGLLAMTIAVGLRAKGQVLPLASFISLLPLVLPNAWIHYETILLLPIVALWWHLRSRPRDVSATALLVVAAVLLAVGNEELAVLGPWWAQSYKFYGVLLVWALSIKEMLREQRT
jgi:hypothetical protein